MRNNEKSKEKIFCVNCANFTSVVDLLLLDKQPSKECINCVANKDNTGINFTPKQK